MSGGGTQPSGQTTTTQTPPPYMYPYVGSALGQAGNLLQTPGPQYYPGQTVAGFTQPQEQAFGAIQKMAGGNPLQSATAYNNALLKGNFTGPNAELQQTGQGGMTNPLLDQMFGQAAGSTRSQLASEFAGSGRNVAASEPLRGEQLNNLATSIYGGAYDADQNRALSANQTLAGEQQGAVGNAQNLVGSNLNLQNALLNVGNQVQGQAQQLNTADQAKFNYYQNLPYQQLSQYEQQLGGVQPGMASSNPYYSNPTANALGEGAAAASIYQGIKGASKAAAA